MLRIFITQTQGNNPHMLRIFRVQTQGNNPHMLRIFRVQTKGGSCLQLKRQPRLTTHNS